MVRNYATVRATSSSFEVYILTRKGYLIESAKSGLLYQTEPYAIRSVDLRLTNYMVQERSGYNLSFAVPRALSSAGKVDPLPQSKQTAQTNKRINA